MDGLAALSFIKSALVAGRVQWSRHLAKSMNDDRVTLADVSHAIEHASVAEALNDGGTKWRLTGPIMNDDDYMVVVVTESGGIIVVTCHNHTR